MVTYTHGWVGSESGEFITYDKIDFGLVLDHAVPEQYRVFDKRSFFDDYAGRQHRIQDGAIDYTAGWDQWIMNPGTGSVSGGRPICLTFLGLDIGTDLPALGRNWAVLFQHIHIGLPVSLDGADITPVAVKRIGEDVIVFNRPGQDVHTEVYLIAGAGQTF